MYSFYKVIRSSVFGLTLLLTHCPDRGKRCIVGRLEVFTSERYVHFSACAHHTKRSKHDRARKRSGMKCCARARIAAKRAPFQAVSIAEVWAGRVLKPPLQGLLHRWCGSTTLYVGGRTARIASRRSIVFSPGSPYESTQSLLLF